MSNTCKTCGENTYPCKCMRDFIQGRDRTALKFYSQAQHGQAIKEAVEKAWISVEDRLPDINTRVLIAMTDGFIQMGKWCDIWIAEMFGGEVTHWMPLPLPPKTGD